MRRTLNVPRSTRIRLLFVGSGAVALGLEAAWFRRMVPVFGASHAVTALLLAVYMSGLAVGATIAARWAERARRPLRAYALCEAVIALSAIASIPLFSLLEHSAASTSLPLAALGATLVLLAPTAAMGATTPLLVRALDGEPSTLRPKLAGLYASNLLGAAIGALTSGFVLLARFGIRSVLLLWALAGAGVALLASLDRGEVSVEPRAASLDSHKPRRSLGAIALLALLALGALSFALQVALGRVAALLLGSTAYTFELLAAVILCSLAAGATLARHDESEPSAIAAVIRRCVRIAVAVFLSMLVVRVAPAFVQHLVRAHRSVAAMRLTLVAALAVWPYVEIGALFPTLASLVRSARDERSAAIASATVTVGNVAGSLIAGFALVPWGGLQWTLRAIAIGALAVALLAALAMDRARLRSTVIACALAVLIGSLLDRPWDAVSLSAGTFRTALNRTLRERDDVPCGPGRALPDTRVLFARDGTLGTVTVLSHADRARACTLYSMRVNGKTEGSVFVAAPPSPRGAVSVDRAQWLAVGDLPSERFVGSALRTVISSPIERAFMVGWGTGISARALIEHPTRALTATEIEPVVIDASRWFDRALHEHPAVTLVRDDARRVLRAMPERSLDAIVSHPSNPWVTGATSLFSQEFFALARSRLRPSGAILAWVQLYEIDLDGVRSLVRTFSAQFDHVIALRTDRRSRDLFLIGAREGLPLDRTRIQAALAGQASIVGDRASLLRWTEGAPVVTDDNALLEYRVADAMLAGREDPRVPALEGL